MTLDSRYVAALLVVSLIFHRITFSGGMPLVEMGAQSSNLEEVNYVEKK